MSMSGCRTGETGATGELTPPVCWNLFLPVKGSGDLPAYSRRGIGVIS